jgi:hypothetical protein
VNRLIVGLVLVLGLLPGVASAGTLCVQLDDNGDVLVMRGVGKGSKAVSGYLADYLGGSSFTEWPISGSSLQDKSGDLWVGLTEFRIGPGGFSENVAFHRLKCSAGSDGKLGPVDSRQDIVKNTNNLPLQANRLGHVVPCIPEVKFP